MKLRKDLATHIPTIPGQAPTMAYGITGGYKTSAAVAQRTLSVMTLNINGLTHHKLPFLAQLLLHYHIDVLICVDSRHTLDQVRSFKKKFEII